MLSLYFPVRGHDDITPRQPGLLLHNGSEEYAQMFTPKQKNCYTLHIWQLCGVAKALGPLL